VIGTGKLGRGDEGPMEEGGMESREKGGRSENWRRKRRLRMEGMAHVIPSIGMTSHAASGQS
jgi:hypothetical protein